MVIVLSGKSALQAAAPHSESPGIHMNILRIRLSLAQFLRFCVQIMEYGDIDVDGGSPSHPIVSC
jgi:hypothetical protein